MRGIERNIGHVLLERGEISIGQLNMAMKVHETARKSGEELLELGIISSHELGVFLDLQLAEILVGMGYVDEQKVFGSLRIVMVQEHQETPKQSSSLDSSDFLDF